MTRFLVLRNRRRLGTKLRFTFSGCRAIGSYSIFDQLNSACIASGVSGVLEIPESIAGFPEFAVAMKVILA